MINYNSMEEARAARHAIHQARITAATVLDHTPVPVSEDTGRALLGATGFTHDSITVSDDSADALIAIGHHDPQSFMAAIHAITDAEGDPFGMLCSGIYSAIYVDELDYADMADWGTEDVWHAHVAVIEHGRCDGGAGVADAAECLCINHTWAMREVPAGTDGAIAVTMYRSGVEDREDWRYADVFGPYRDADETVQP